MSDRARATPSGSGAPPAIEIRGAGKVYRLYQKPAYRVLDLFGLCPSGEAYYREHAALEDVDLTVGRGEKVAIIGRNGAGKSTLLKIITGNIAPTRGSVDVHGRVSALLQIGTGFHPDFTGRQNVYSSLAHLGITGRAADEKFEEVVDFAELEEYIDQPMKTYSTGMGARLMFSAATVIEPDILVIDELLGVGDAYFSHKSFERIRQLCAKVGTTLLLVTHDIYSAVNVCERFIWIDRGRIKLQGDGKTIINAYENSIKEQEEERLRRRNQSALVREQGAFTGLNVRFGSRSGFALPAPLALGRLEVRYDDGRALVLPVAEGSPGWNLLPEGNLGEAEVVDGRPCRVLRPFGSIYHKAEWSVAVPRGEGIRELVVDYHYQGRDPVIGTLATDSNRTLATGPIEAAPGWARAVIPCGNGAGESAARGGIHGNARITIESIELLDAAGRTGVQAKRGESLVVRVGVRVRDPSAPRDPTFVLSLHREGVAQAARVLTDRLQLPAGADEVEVRIELSPLLLGSARYFVSVSIFEPDYFFFPDNVFFTVNPRCYCSVSRALEFVVPQTHPADPVTFFYHPARIQVRAKEAANAAQAPSE